MGNMIGFSSVEAQMQAAEEDMIDAKEEADRKHVTGSGCTTCGARTRWIASADDTPHPVIRTETDYIAADGRCPTCRRDNVPRVHTFDEYVRLLLSPCEPPDRKNPPKPADPRTVCNAPYCCGESHLRRTLENTIRFDVVWASFRVPLCIRCLWIEVQAARFCYAITVDAVGTWLELNPREKV